MDTINGTSSLPLLSFGVYAAAAPVGATGSLANKNNETCVSWGTVAVPDSENFTSTGNLTIDAPVDIVCDSPQNVNYEFQVNLQGRDNSSTRRATGDQNVSSEALAKYTYNFSRQGRYAFNSTESVPNSGSLNLSDVYQIVLSNPDADVLASSPDFYLTDGGLPSVIPITPTTTSSSSTSSTTTSTSSTTSSTSSTTTSTSSTTTSTSPTTSSGTTSTASTTTSGTLTETQTTDGITTTITPTVTQVVTTSAPATAPGLLGSSGAVAGVAVGAAVLLFVLLAVAGFCLSRRHGRKRPRAEAGTEGIELQNLGSRRGF